MDGDCDALNVQIIPIVCILWFCKALCILYEDSDFVGLCRGICYGIRRSATSDRKFTVDKAETRCRYTAIRLDCPIQNNYFEERRAADDPSICHFSGDIPPISRHVFRWL